jgi:ATP-dependent DNA helicase 2 subunit 2
LSVHRNLPSNELQDAMNAYVDKMDLSKAGKDDEGEEAEYAPIDETYSPMLHRINQVIKHRAVHHDAAPPEPMEILTKYSQPPEDLVQQNKKALDRLIQAADVKKVPPKARSKRFGKKGREEKPLSDLDIGALLASDPGRKSHRIDPKNAIPEFKQHILLALDPEPFADLVKQMKNIIFDCIRHSVGNSGYGKAIEGISAVREVMLDLEAEKTWTEFITEVKKKLLAGELGGDRKDMWYQIRVNRLGLLRKKEYDGLDLGVSEEDAKAFLSAK